MIMAAVYDKVSDRLDAPMLYPNKEDLIRACLIACQNPDSLLNLRPADFEIHILCDYNQNLAKNDNVVFNFDIAEVISLIDLVGDNVGK